MIQAFERFGTGHALGVLLVLVECALVVWVCQRQPDLHRRVGAVLAAVTFSYMAQAYIHRWRHLLPSESLPLHLCDVVLFLGLIMLVQSARGRTPWGLARELVYFWGCGLTVFALITPDLEVGFPHWRYFEFFWGHGLIFVIAAYLLACHGMPHRSREWWTPLRASGWIIVYMVLVGGFNHIFGWNYGYLCTKPLGGSILDLLGPWPVYLVAGLVLSTLEFYALWLPVRALSRG